MQTYKTWLNDLFDFQDADVDEQEDVQLEPEIKTAASLSHAMLQQLTVSA
jgi:hypothetical protein